MGALRQLAAACQIAPLRYNAGIHRTNEARPCGGMPRGHSAKLARILILKEKTMARTYRVGVIGFAHMHVNTLVDAFAALPNVQWVACADTTPDVPSRSMERSTRGANLKRAREETGIPKSYADYREMLDKERFDIMIFCPENAKHAEVAEAVAAKGIHLLTEKPMANTLAGAQRMARAALYNKVSLLTNWPITWWPAVRKIKELVDQGEIGQVLQVRVRNGYSLGPLPHLPEAERGAEWWHRAAAGGGALLDYCCYGACLARYYVGEPAVAAFGMKANLNSRYGDAEDNAVITVRFREAMATLEGSWTTTNAGVPSWSVVYGRKGTLVLSQRRGQDGVSVPVVEVYKKGSYGGGEPPERVVEAEALPAGRATIAEEMIHHLETGEPPHPTLELAQNLEAMAILDAGIRSAANGKLELVNDATWCIG